MEKLKGYLGLLVAIVLALFLMPVGPLGFYPERAPALTPFDRTVISRLAFNSTDAWKLRQSAARFFSTCDRADGKPSAPWGPQRPSCMFLYANIDDLALIRLVAEASANGELPPEINVQTVHDHLTKVSAGQAKGSSKSGDLALLSERFKFAKPLGQLIVDRIERADRSLARGIWVANILTIALVVLVVIGRRKVGGVIVGALGKVFGCFGALFRAIRNLHNKV